MWDANDVISMRVQDVTPEYVHDIKALGLKPSSNELISMKVQDVTPEYVKALQSAGFESEHQRYHQRQGAGRDA